MRRIIRIAGFILLMGAAGCSTTVKDRFQRALGSATLKSESALILVSNTTTQGQATCATGNNVVIQTSFPAGQTAYCRDRSALTAGLPLGPVCPGGVTIAPITLPASPGTDCKKLTLCGVAPSKIEKVGSRTDGGEIDNLTFSNLPWGCDGQVDLAFDPGFSSAGTSSLEVHVQPPDCPYCPTQFAPSCLTCTGLGSGQTIVSGQIIDNSCGTQCAACPVIGQPTTTVPHAQGQVYYQSAVGSCGNRCANQSLLRICDNGLWKGDPSYSFPQCSETACGCTLPGSSVTYAHNSSLTVYSTASPACGVECSTQGLTMTCKDGTWQSGSPAAPVSSTALQTYSHLSCSKRVCDCPRAGRDIVADGQTKTVYSQDTVSCTQTCDTFAGAVTCNSGTLSATTPAFLTYAYDTCTQQNCGCLINLASGPILLANGGSTNLFKYSQNSPGNPDACTDPTDQLRVTCTNRVVSPAFDPAVFQYNSCTTHAYSCTFTDGVGNQVVVASGANLTVSVTSTPACGVACQNLTLTCQNTVFKKMVSGSLVTVAPAELALYKSSSSCTPKNCDCNINGNIIPYNTTLSPFYSVSQSTNCDPNGCNNAQASITCTATGPTSSRGDNAFNYQYRTCNVVPCGCPVPWGGTIESGKTIKVFSLQSANCATPDACSNAANYAVVSCNNGNMTSYDTTTYRYPTCSPAVCTCSYAGVQTPFGQTLKVFQTQHPSAGVTCNSVSATVTCNSGGTWSGANLALYPYVTCNDFTDSGTGSGGGGGTGNDEGPGSAIKKRIGLGDGGGGDPPPPCLDFHKCRLDNIDVGVASFVKTACVLPWGGGEAEFYASVAAFDTQCVVTPGDKCSNHRIVRMCHFPKWTGGDQYKYPSCKEQSTCP